RRRLPGLQAEWLGRAAPLRSGESARPPHQRHRPQRVERLRLRTWPDPARHDALRDRRYSLAAERRSAFPEPVLMKFSYSWIRSLVDGLDVPAEALERLITMKTAE